MPMPRRSWSASMTGVHRVPAGPQAPPRRACRRFAVNSAWTPNVSIRVVDPGQQEVQVDSPGLGDPQPPRVGVGHRGGGGEFPLSLIPAEQPAQLEREHQLRLEPGSAIAGNPYQPLGEQAVGQQRGSIGRGEQQRRVGWQVTVHCEHRMPQDVRMIVGAGQRFDKLAPQPPGPHRVHSSPHRFPVQRVRQPGLPPPAKPLYRHQAPVSVTLDGGDRGC